MSHSKMFSGIAESKWVFDRTYKIQPKRPDGRHSGTTIKVFIWATDLNVLVWDLCIGLTKKNNRDRVRRTIIESDDHLVHYCSGLLFIYKTTVWFFFGTENKDWEKLEPEFVREDRGLRATTKQFKNVWTF